VRHALRAPASFLYQQPGARYDLSAQVVDMADLGVPQHRERLMIVGMRRDLGERPPLIPTPAADRHVTVREALEKPPIAEDAPNHERGLDSPEVVERLKLIPPDKNYEVIPPDHPLAVKGLISHVYRRLDPDQPSYTIIANGGGGTHGYHHIEPRRLSNRERARLQTFPDDFVFADGGPGRSAYPRVRRQIGNAVPPRAAEIVLAALVHSRNLHPGYPRTPHPRAGPRERGSSARRSRPRSARRRVGHGGLTTTWREPAMDREPRALLGYPPRGTALPPRYAAGRRRMARGHRRGKRYANQGA